MLHFGRLRRIIFRERDIMVLAKRAHVRAGVLVFVCFCSSTSFADSFNDDLTKAEPMPAAIHATRLDYSELDSPEAVTIITQDDIRRAGYLNVSEIFRAVPGFRLE